MGLKTAAMTDMLEKTKDDSIKGRRPELLRGVESALASGIGAEMMLGARAMSEAIQNSRLNT